MMKKINNFELLNNCIFIDIPELNEIDTNYVDNYFFCN